MSQVISLLGQTDGNGDGQFYVKKVNGASTVTYPVTAQLGTENGSTYLMSGIIIQFGTVKVTTSPQAISFNMTFPNNVYSCVLTGQDDDASPFSLYIQSSTLTTSGFSAICDDLPKKIHYITIGN